MATENATEFDPEEHKRENQAVRDIKRTNLNRVFGQGPGRIAIIGVGGTFLVLAGIGFYGLTHRSDATQTQLPTGAAPGTAGAQGDQMVASAQEAALRRQANQQAAADAAANHTPYMAQPVLEASGTTQTTAGSEWGGFSASAPVQASHVAAQAPDPASNPNSANYSAQPAAGEAASVHQVVDVHKLATELSAANGDVGSQIGSVLGGTFGSGDGSQPSQQPRRRSMYTIGYYPSEPTEQSTGSGTLAANSSATSLPGAGATSGSANAQTAATQTATRVLPGWTLGTAFYCKIKYGANSDLVRRDVFADCYNGVANGATFYGTAEPSNEGVADPGFTVTFDSVHIPNQGTYTVKAVAYTNDTLEASVADDVNSHAVVKFTELGIAGLLKGVGQAFQVVTGTSNTTTVGNVSTTAISVQTPNLGQIAGSAAGGVGTSIGDFVQKRSESLKTTIKIYPNKDIGIVLIADVTEKKQ